MLLCVDALSHLDALLQKLFIQDKTLLRGLLNLALVSPEGSRRDSDSDCHCFKIFVIILADESICC